MDNVCSAKKASLESQLRSRCNEIEMMQKDLAEMRNNLKVIKNLFGSENNKANYFEHENVILQHKISEYRCLTQELYDIIYLMKSSHIRNKLLNIFEKYNI